MDSDPDPVVHFYGLEEEKITFSGDYRQREKELLTRLKGKKTPMGQDRVGVLKEHPLTWSSLEKVWKKEIKIKLDVPRRRGKGPKPLNTEEKNLNFGICGIGTTEEKCLDKAWLEITNAFHSRMNPKAPTPKAPPVPSTAGLQ